ncbi:DUF6318 family protein [Citricoccus muralis]|uniref:DUF6318 domain-containing protein n=1 Tax=Citricoccus muralis TaxID=169134 RepID=A0A3D9LBB9_9MICC|nr:DUF6318 family protein [Citricoccus muralis]REE02974.1 hypothetical protein C8E99_0769 [Citricoccus muralis]
MTDPVNRPVRLAGLAGVVAVGLVLAGCSGDGGEGASSSAAPSATEVSTGSASPTGTGSDSASPSSSASGTYEPATETSPATNVPIPEMPEAAKEPTEEGLEAAVEFWWEAAYYLQLTGESGPFEAISAEECIICQDQLSNWKDLYGSGGWSTGSEFDIERLVVDLNDDGTGTTVMEVIEGPTHQYRSSGEEYASEDADKTFQTSWSGYATFDDPSGHWIIEELVVQSDSEIDG